ncbi:MAG: hypothetical protein RMK29_12825 [Myxococcales bacterium]|nr:hypothetical protein [Myxococcota bacterium]MDW8282588.1 hypothetical protein [Myxococcales bacterium]
MTLTVGRGGAETRLALPRPGRLAYRILDEQGRPMPGKISIVGAPLVEDPAVSSPYERNLPGLVAVHHALHGDSDAGGRWDQPLVLPPGDYRVVVSRGPEWTRHEERISLQAGGEVRVVARLAHAVPTPGYVACDFHQHTVRSPDSAVLVEDRVVTYLAEGVDFVSTSDHDVIIDLEPAIAALGASAQLDSVPGVEMTPFGYGHFISFPLPFDPLSPTGGAFDWGGGEEPNIAPAGIFAGVRALGARVIQINHPRTPAPSTLDF